VLAALQQHKAAPFSVESYEGVSCLAARNWREQPQAIALIDLELTPPSMSAMAMVYQEACHAIAIQSQSNCLEQGSYIGTLKPDSFSLVKGIDPEIPARSDAAIRLKTTSYRLRNSPYGTSPFPFRKLCTTSLTSRCWPSTA
jgi:hypothetical protein